MRSLIFASTSDRTPAPATLMTAERRLVEALALYDALIAGVADEPVDVLREKLAAFGEAVTDAAPLVRAILLE